MEPSESEATGIPPPSTPPASSTPNRKVRWMANIASSLGQVWRFSGPGALATTASMNAGSIEAFTEVGGSVQFKLLWLGLVTSVLGVVLQRLAIRLGSTSKRGLADHCTTFYCKAPRLFKWVLMELSILSVDMQNVIGTAVALYILTRAYVPLYAGVLLSLFDTVTLLFVDKYSSRRLEHLYGVFILIMVTVFGFVYVKVSPDQKAVLSGIVTPECQECSKQIYMLVVGLIGASLSPHNLFLHSGLVKEIVERESVDAEKIPGVNMILLIEYGIATVVSYVFAVFVTSVMGATLFDHTNSDLREQCVASGSPFANVFPNDTEKATADLYKGGVYLGCRYGTLVLSMWSLGVLTAALTGTLHSCRSGRFIMEGFLGIQWSHWKRSVVVRLLSSIPLAWVAWFEDVGTLLAINSTLNLLLSLHLPGAAIATIALTSNRTIMGDAVSSKFSTLSSLLLTAGVVATNVYMGVRLAIDWLPSSWGYFFGAAVLALGYLAHIVYLLLDMASSTGASKKLAACKLGQRYLNQPCGME